MGAIKHGDNGMNHISFVISLIDIGYMASMDAVSVFSKLGKTFDSREHNFDGQLQASVILPTVPAYLATRIRKNGRFRYELERLD